MSFIIYLYPARNKVIYDDGDKSDPLSIAKFAVTVIAAVTARSVRGFSVEPSLQSTKE